MQHYLSLFARSLPAQVFFALIVGIIFGIFGGNVADQSEILGTLFIRLIEMVVIPLLFPLIVLGMTEFTSSRDFGRVGGKTIIYFEIVTTIVLVFGIVLAEIANVGKGANLNVSDTSSLQGINHSVDFKHFIVNIIPKNIFQSLGDGNIIALVFFSILFGLALAKLGKNAEPMINVLKVLRDVMFKIITGVIRLAPIGVFGAISHTVAHYGFAILAQLAYLIAIVYLGLFLIMFVIFPLIGKLFGVSWSGLFRSTSDLLILAFSTRSGEVVMAPMMRRLEDCGISNSLVSFIIPLGYSFNLAGAGLYLTTALVFLVNGYQMHLGLGGIVEAVLLLVVLTKGLSGVPSAAIVVLLAASSTLGIPTQGVALLVGVDFILDMARTAIDVFGTPLAAAVIAKSENAISSTVKENCYPLI